MARPLFLLALVLLLAAAANSHAVKVTVTVEEPTPSVTLPPKPSVTLPPKPSVTLPPKPSVTLPPKPSLALTMPPKPSVTLSPKPSMTLSPKPSVTLSPKPSVALPPKPAVTLPPKPAVTLPPKGEALVKVLVQNTATKAVAIKVAELGAKGKEVVAKTGKWTLVGTFKVSVRRNQVLHLSVTVSNDKGVPVTKELVLDLLKRFRSELQGKKFLVLKAVEETKTGVLGTKEKLLKIWMDAQVVLTINLSA